MWFIIGILIGIALLSLMQWMRNNKVSLTWYEWLLGIVGFLLLLFTIQNFFGLREEVLTQPAWFTLLLLGVPALVLLGVTWQLVTRKQRSN